MMNIMNPPADWSTMKKLIWLRGTPINGGEELTVSGTPPLSLTNSLGKPLKAWEVDVLPYQEGTGDPAPDNVRPIHGTDKLTITAAGKNLIDDSIKTAQGQSLYIGANSAYVYPFHLVAGTYTLSVFGIPNCYGYIREENDATHTVVIASSTTGTVTLAKAGNYRIWLYGDNAVSGNVSGVMLTVGSDAPTSYVPYLAPSQTVLTLPQTIYAGTIGSDGGESRWGEVDLGTLNWSPSSPDNHIFRSDALQGTIEPSSDSMIPTPAICEQFTAMAWSPISARDNGKFAIASVSGSKAGRIVIIDHRYTTTSDFINAVTGVKLVFPLLNPQTFSPTTQDIPTPIGDATAWVVAEDGVVDSMNVTYVGKA